MSRPEYIPDKKETLIDKYAHDYRDMKMGEEELAEMLARFQRDILEIGRAYERHLFGQALGADFQEGDLTK